MPYNLGGPDLSLASGNNWNWDFDGNGDIDNPNGYRGAVENTANFGPSGTVPVTINTFNLATINPATLGSLDGFITCWWDDFDVPSGAANDIVNFFLGGGDLILLCDDSGHDLIAETLGLPISGSDGSVSNGGAPLLAGPFGTATDVTQAVSRGQISAADITAHNGHAGATNASGEITAAYWDDNEYALGAGRMAIVADVDMWSLAFGNVTYNPPNDNAIFALNTTAFIVGGSVTPTNPGVTITQTGGSTDVTEAGGTDTYTVVLNSMPTGNVTISMNPGSQLATSPTSLVFTPSNWDTARTVTVSAIDDSVIEGNHSGTVTHAISSSDSAYQVLSVASVPVNITDNEQAGVIFTPASRLLSVLEGRSRSYSAVLNAAPTSNVTLTLTPDPQLSVSSSTMVFTSFDWFLPHPVTVTANENTLLDGSRFVTISHAATSIDSAFNGVPVASMVVEIIDNDNTLIVNGTDRADRISVLFSGNFVQAIVNGKSSFHPVTFSQVLVLASAGNDSIILAHPSLPVAISGDAGSDKVQIDGQAAANAFVLDATTVSINGREVALLEVENALLNGKNFADTFTVESMPEAGVKLQGLGGADRIIGNSQDNAWKITGPDSGSLNGTITFNSVEQFVGDIGDDTFAFAAGKSISGQIDGGGGSNTLDFSAYKSAITANLQTNGITGTKGFANITRIVGGFGLDKLIGPAASNTWDITAASAGTVGSTTFASFESLVGGSLDDTFVLADGVTLKGKIDGGGGTDMLDYGSYLAAVTVNLQTKAATFTGGWLNLERFAGGSGVDKLIASNKVNTWSLAGTGTGTITGGVDFQNFENLTGGTVADTFDLTTGGNWLGLVDGSSGLDTLLSGGGAYVLTGLNAGTLNTRAFKSIENRQ